LKLVLSDWASLLLDLVIKRNVRNLSKSSKRIPQVYFLRFKQMDVKSNITTNCINANSRQRF
jgi:hypothetical protein